MFGKKNKKPVESVTRSASFSLMVILVMVCLPLLPLLPGGVIAVAVAAVLWRVLLLRSWGKAPNWLVRSLLVVLSLAFILLHYGTLLGLEAGAATLVSAYSLKLLEMRSRRDALLLSFLGFFVAVTGLLFSQSIPMTLYLLCCLMMLVSVLVGLHQPPEQSAVMPVIKTGLIFTLQALPLMVLLFILVPRIPPLWAVPLPDNSAKTGLSDEMAPGDIARLSQSDALAFRATFTGAVPPPDERYWRAVVMYGFDGRRWSQGKESDWAARGVGRDQLVSWYPAQPLWAASADNTDENYRYDIILEPNGRPWLPTLGSVSSAVADTGITRDWRLLARENVDLLRQYQLVSGTDQGFDRQLPPWLMAASLQLPRDGNPRAYAYAAELAEEYGNNSSGLVSAVLRRFREQEYFYTLRPPTLSEDTIDGFLFDSQRGFCAHYAGALTFLLRAAGVPARVVAGYQGGELKNDKVIQVRQFDAHAWVEYWQQDYGWQRVDPTAAVAPNRIEKGLESAVAEEGSFLEKSLMSPARYRHINWLNAARLQYENLEYQWQRLVLSYDEDRQKSLFQKLFPGEDTLLVLTRLLVISVLLVMGVTALALIKPWRQRPPPVDRYYQRFCRRMARKGLVRQRGEGPEDYARRIVREQPQLGREAMQVSALYIRLLYGSGNADDLSKLRRLA